MGGGPVHVAHIIDEICFAIGSSQGACVIVDVGMRTRFQAYFRC